MTYNPPYQKEERLLYDEGYNDGEHHERTRILAALKVRCDLLSFCRLNRGHIGKCSAQTDTITVTMDRLEEILNG